MMRTKDWWLFTNWTARLVRHGYYNKLLFWPLFFRYNFICGGLTGFAKGQPTTNVGSDIKLSILNGNFEKMCAIKILAQKSIYDKCKDFLLWLQMPSSHDLDTSKINSSLILDLCKRFDNLQCKFYFNYLALHVPATVIMNKWRSGYKSLSAL